MENFLNILLMVDSGIMIILVLLQSGKSDGLSAAFTGSGDLNLFAVQKRTRLRKGSLVCHAHLRHHFLRPCNRFTDCLRPSGLFYFAGKFLYFTDRILYEEGIKDFWTVSKGRDLNEGRNC